MEKLYIGKNAKSRGRNVVYNSIASIVCNVLSYLISFVYRSVFIRYLNAEYLGLQGVFGNILQLLSLAELGIGSAMLFSMYKPLYEHDNDKLSALLNYYKKAYQIISVIVLLLGVAMLPLLDFFIGDAPNVAESLHIIYLFYLCNSVVSYVCVYKQALLSADQKGFIVTIATALFQIIRTCLQILVLTLTRSYLLTLSIQIICTLVTNVFCSRIAQKMYPEVLSNHVEVLGAKDKTAIRCKIGAMMKYRLGAYVVDGTDSLLITKFCGLASAGIYSNYLLIISMLRVFINYIAKALTPSIGNFEAQQGKQAIRGLIEKVNFVFFVLTSICTVCLYNLINPFIHLWIGENYILEHNVVVFICVNFYLTGMHQGMLVFRNALGLYTYLQFKPIAEAAINLIASIICGLYWGMAGVLAATTLSFLLTAFWIEPYVLYKKYEMSGMMRYWKMYGLYALITLLAVVCTELINKYITSSTIVLWIVSAVFNVIITIGLITLFLFKTEVYKDTLRHIRCALRRQECHGK